MGARPDILAARAEIVRMTRAFFDSRGFIEVDTPCRIPAPAPEPHIDCPPVSTGGFLRASPELQMKKLLAAGMDKIYQIGPCWRDGERGRRHSPEFTMLEWYRRGERPSAIAADLVALVTSLARLFGREGVFRPCRNITVRDAYAVHAGWDPFENWDEDRFDEDMALKIEPALAREGGAVFLAGYPPQAASLARLRDGVADRWEFYAGGLELANCFGELCDGAEQRARFEAAREKRRALGEADYPLDEDFLDAVGRMSRAAGVALGVDRLVMLLLGAPSIDSVRAGC